jgi:branched-chain amino acid transport system ATP-binding protein
MPAIIDVKNIRKSFGGFTALNDCSLTVEKGSITGLIGPNGAGKTTLFNIIAGNLKPDRGVVTFDGEDITGMPPHELFSKGMLRTFQIAHEFSNMTVLENLMVVPASQKGEGLVSAWFRPRVVAAQERSVRDRAEAVVEMLQIAHLKHELAGKLSGGQKKLLELGRTMMVDARIVLLDEIAAGVNRTLLNRLAGNIERLNREKGYTFFVIEHDMDIIARLCAPVIVMAEGRVMRTGSIADIQRDPAVIEAYFGGSFGGQATSGAQ